MLAPNATPIGTLDDLLDQICAELQLTNTQYLDAQQKYEAIGRWLSEGTSPLVNRILRIYPQGSMALGTTVRPRHHEEFDLDLILLVMHGGSPAELRNAVVLRMLDHATYAKNLDLTKPRLRSREVCGAILSRRRGCASGPSSRRYVHPSSRQSSRLLDDW